MKEEDNTAAGQIQKAEAAAKEIQNLAKKMMPQDALQVANDAKAQGAEVFTSQIGDKWFVFRSLGRFEYQNLLLEQSKQIAQLQEQADNEMALNILSKMREQNSTVLASVLYPKLDQMSIKLMPSGVIDTLYNSIMLACGYGQEPMPIKL